MNKDVKERWLAALRSGEYKQSKNFLKHPIDGGENIGYCCLGVLCDLYIKEKNNPNIIWDINLHGTHIFKSSISDVLIVESKALPEQLFEWAGLDEKNPAICYHDMNTSLAELNDNGKTFEEIALVIEERL